MSALPFVAAIGFLGGTWCFAKCAARWDFGLHALIVMLLFGGIVSVDLGSGAYHVIFRDIFIVLPLYMSFFSRRTGQYAAARTPFDLICLLTLLLVAILLSLFNPLATSAEQILIGIKVWLYYIPFFSVGLALAEQPDRLLRFLREVLFWGSAACIVGLTQSLLVRVAGYEQVMGWFFGDHAASVTQGFAVFDVAGGIYRIPGTFSFASQYAQFLHFYIAIALIEANVDTDAKIRKLAQIALFLGVGAALLSGAREAIIFVPATLCLYFFCGLLRSSVMLTAPIGVLFGVLLLRFSNLDLAAYFFEGQNLMDLYERDFIWDQIEGGLSHGLLGAGIGSSTGPARYAAVGVTGGFTDVASVLGFESYFAKAAAELGWLGLAAVVLIMGTIALRSVSSVLVSWRHGRPIVAPLAIYLLYNVVMSFKAFVLDTDPGNITIWLSFGLMTGIVHQRTPRPAVFAAGAPSLEQSLFPNYE